MLDVSAVKKVLSARSNRGAGTKSLVAWLNGLKKRAWSSHPEILDQLIKEVQDGVYFS